MVRARQDEGQHEAAGGRPGVAGGGAAEEGQCLL